MRFCTPGGKGNAVAVLRPPANSNRRSSTVCGGTFLSRPHAWREASIRGELIIREFAEHDRAELRALFRHAGEGSPSATLWGHEESEAAIYLVPYMDREPESLFLAFADGQIVGYQAGCLESSRIPSEGERISKAISEYHLIFRPRVLSFFARSLADIVAAKVRREPMAGDFADPRWPAHLHINVVPEARGSGAATGLMHRWFARLVETGTPGCYLQTLAENARAVRFFTRMGFTTHGPALLIPGLRSDGKPLHQQTMVWRP